MVDSEPMLTERFGRPRSGNCVDVEALVIGK